MNVTSAVAGDPKLAHEGSWSQPASPTGFPSRHIDVWRVRLDKSVVPGLEGSILSPDEMARASRFHFEKDRLHFSRCRSALRFLLADYLVIPAAEICFDYMANGKPQLAAAQNPRALVFNVAHSSSMALIAFGSGERLGVDIERIRGDVDTKSLAERFFSVRERAGLRALPDHLRAEAFYACWTRKEAFLKATGDGLSFPLANFSVSTNPERHPELEEIDGNMAARKKWFLADLSVGEGYRAAVAIDRSDCRLRTYGWN